MVDDMKIFEVVEVNEAYVNAVNRLLLQLSSSPAPFTADVLAGIVDSPSSHLFFVECENVIVGMLTVGEYLAPTGRKMWIEDVVVDEAMRGRSIGCQEYRWRNVDAYIAPFACCSKQSLPFLRISDKGNQYV